MEYLGDMRGGCWWCACVRCMCVRGGGGDMWVGEEVFVKTNAGGPISQIAEKSEIIVHP